MLIDTLSEDLRSIKTEKALFSAIFSLLKKMNFKKITVKCICEKALISRAAFYAHFVDKYDLLQSWFASICAGDFWESSYEHLEDVFGRHQGEMARVIKNILGGADDEIHQLLFNFLLSTNLPALNDSGESNQPKDVVLSNFYAGGIISYLMWQVNNDFPTQVPLLNREVFRMLNGFSTGL